MFYSRRLFLIEFHRDGRWCQTLGYHSLTHAVHIIINPSLYQIVFIVENMFVMRREKGMAGSARALHLALAFFWFWTKWRETFFLRFYLGNLQSWGVGHCPHGQLELHRGEGLHLHFLCQIPNQTTCLTSSLHSPARELFAERYQSEYTDFYSLKSKIILSLVSNFVLSF